MLMTLPRYAIKSSNLLHVTGRRRGYSGMLTTLPRYAIKSRNLLHVTGRRRGYKNSIIRQFHSLSIDTFAASYTMLTSLPGFMQMILLV